MSVKNIYAKIDAEMYKKLQIISERAGLPINKTVEKLIKNNGTKIFDREIIKNLSEQLPHSMFLFGENQRLQYDFSVTENIENLCLAAIFAEDWSQELFASPSKIFFNRFPVTLKYFLLQDILYNNRFSLIKSTVTVNEFARMDALEIARNALFDGELLEEYNKVKEDITNKYIDSMKECNTNNVDFGKLFEIILFKDITLFGNPTIIKRFGSFMEFLKTDIDMKEYFSKYAYISQRDVLNPQTMFRNSINILNNDSLEINYNEMGLLLEHCQSFLAANHLDYSFDVISKYHECINIFKREEKNSIDHNVTIPPQNIKVLTEPYKFLFLLYQANINKERKFVFSRYQILDVLKEDIPVEKKIESKTTQNDISLFFSLDLYMNYNCILSINDMKIKLDAREFIVFVENTAKTSHTSLNLGNGMLSITHTEQKEETKMITESCKQMIESKEYRILKDIYSKSIGLI